MVKKLKNWILHLVILVVIATVAIVVAGKYFLESGKHLYQTYQQDKKLKSLQARRDSYQCNHGENEIIVLGGKVCREIVPESKYMTIFDTYPISSEGKEDMYDMLSQGTIEEANQILDNKIPIDRYDIVNIEENITWDEDPYGERYWRFAYYGFRHLSNLFFAFDQTYDTKYLLKAKELVLSFINDGIDNEHSWDDFHAVAFRTMFLEKTWWQLRTNNLLSYADSEIILKSIEGHANFLADPNHYEKGHNHGLNEAGALYSVAANFPILDKDGEWGKLATSRLSNTLTNLVDEDGVLVENSPYYHFYTLEKYWEIARFSNQFDYPISSIFNERLEKMIQHAIYILQPNSEIPLLGASLKRQIFNSGIYKEIAEKYPEFRYVLTQGEEGEMPKLKNTVFKSSGEVIMRSAWGDNTNFNQQTQVVFDVGPYRTQHSDLDGLSFNLYSEGRTLLPDAGLYTYTPGEIKDYFHGTSSHNTATVDNLDQAPGKVSMGKMIEGDRYVSQSGEHELYKGVTHKRTISLIGQKYLLILDDLNSEQEHLYTQLFHTFTGATVTYEGTTVRVDSIENDTKKQAMSIYQLLPSNLQLEVADGQLSPPRGLCSTEYNKTQLCNSIEYSTTTKSTRFVTLIEIGQHDPYLTYSYDNNVIHIQDSEDIIDISTSLTEGVPGNIEVIKDAPKSPREIETVNLDVNNWQKNSSNEDRGAIIEGKGYIEFKPKEKNKTFTVTTDANLNLSNKDLLIKMFMSNVKQGASINLDLSTNNWQGKMSINLRKSYTDKYSGEWISTTIGKSIQRDSKYGGWSQSGTGFDWAKIDKIGIRVESKSNYPTSLKIAKISTTPGANNGKIFIIFDDAYESILPAAKVMSEYGYKGTTAVIADRVQNNQRLYLSLDQLRELQDKYGWDIVNHSQHHLDAVETYYSDGSLDDYELDVLGGAEFLINNNLNKAPNWYVYPHGATNKSIIDVIKKYYLFARTTNNQTESYPFADSYRIKTISADSSEAPSTTKFTSVLEIEKAIRDAQKYRTPLFITFHRIHSTSTDRPGYPIDDFTKIIQYINKIGANVYTLSQFDKENGIAETKISITHKIPSYIDVNISINRISLVNQFKYKVLNLWQDIINLSNSIKQILKLS